MIHPPVNRTVSIILLAVRCEVGPIYLSFTLRIISFIVCCLFDCLMTAFQWRKTWKVMENEWRIIW
jgi:hypothetical protein